MKFFWPFIILVLTVITSSNSDLIPQSRLELGENVTMELGGICAGDTVIIGCYGPSIDGIFRLNYNFGRSIVMTDQYGAEIVITVSSQSANYDTVLHEWKLTSEPNQVGKVYNYRCLYGELPYVDGKLKLENCNRNSNYTDPNNCYVDWSDPVRRQAIWNCSFDGPLQHIVKEGHRLELNCNGNSTDSKSIWFFKGRQIFSCSTNCNKLLTNKVSLSDSGLYTCLSRGKSSGQVLKRYFSVEVIPELQTITDLRGVQEGENLLVSWKPIVEFVNVNGRIRSRVANLTYTIWYNAVYRKGFNASHEVDGYGQRSIDANNFTLKILNEAVLYLVTVQSFNNTGEVTPKVSGSFFVNNASDTVEEVRKIGDIVDLKCGTDQFGIRYETEPLISRTCTDNLGVARTMTMMEFRLQQEFLPGDDCVYECYGKIYPYEETERSSSESVDFRFVTKLRMEDPDSKLPTVRTVGCAIKSLYSTDITWTVEQSTTNQSMKAMLIFGNNHFRSLFTTDLDAGKYRSEKTCVLAMSPLWIVVQDEFGRQGIPTVHGCSNTDLCAKLILNG